MKNRQSLLFWLGKRDRSLEGWIFLAWVTVLGSSCGNVKNLQYLQGPLDSANLRNYDIPEARIQKGDLLGITVYSEDPASTAAVINQAPTMSSATPTTGGSTPSPGYLVDQRGNIQLFKLGILPVEGKTQKELSDTLATLYVQDSLLRNPYVEVRFLNFKITLLGEVNRPGAYSTPTDKVSVLDAIALAGDITALGRKDNVLIVREIDGVRQFGRLDLGKTDVFLSPYYFLKQNDLVIVDVGKNKSAVNDQIFLRNISIATTIISTLILVYSVFIE